MCGLCELFLILTDPLPIAHSVLAHLGIKLKPNTCFGLVSGSHTYFLAADTPEEVRGEEWRLVRNGEVA